jgi:GT2 family glycosyltransferase
MRKELVSIIIPYWNQKEFIRHCFEGLFKNTLYPYYEVIVVDAGSNDGGEKIFKEYQRLRKIKYIKNENRTVFARTCNRGTEVANGDYLLF